MPADLRYDHRKWRRLRAHQLRIEPLCRYCARMGKVEPAVVADHIEPHKGDRNQFWTGRLQSLCLVCHNKIKQEIERQGWTSGCDVTGMPLDRRHPAWRER